MHAPLCLADVASKLRERLEATNAVIGEAASIGLGLVMLGSGDKDTYDAMYSFAKETQHEKIIRGIAVGAALLMYVSLANVLYARPAIAVYVCVFFFGVVNTMQFIWRRVVFS